MPQVKFTQRWIDRLEKPASRVVYSDTATRNLSLVVHKTGLKVFVWRGRVGGKVNTLTLGDTTVHTLEEACAWANDKTAGRNVGHDVEAEHKTAKRKKLLEKEAENTTVAALFDLYMKHDGGKIRTSATKRRLMEREVIPKLGKKKFAEVKRSDLMAIVAAKVREGKYAMSNRIFSEIGVFWKWCANHPVAVSLHGHEVNVFAGTMRAAAPVSKDRVLSDYEIKLIWNLSAELSTRDRVIVRLLMLTGCRSGEIVGLRRSEIDAEVTSFTLPTQRSKNYISHFVPLTATAQAELKAALALSDGDVVFPVSGGKTVIKNFGRTKRILTKKMLKADPTLTADWTIHDIRRTVRTKLSELRVPNEVAEAVMNHKPPGIVGVYNRYRFEKEKLEALTLWETEIKRLVEGA